jgi:hypothetical protein
MRRRLLLTISIGNSDPEIIIEIMRGAPDYWSQIINPMTIHDVEGLQSAIYYHEHQLKNNASKGDLSSILDRIKSLEKGGNRSHNHYSNSNSNNNSYKKKPWKAKVNEVEAETQEATTQLIGAHPSIKPTHPRDDSVISKGQTPGQKGARPCRHCGSPNHWDFDCKHSPSKQNFKKGSGGKKNFKNFRKFRKAKTNFLEVDPEAFSAFVEYEQAYVATIV